MASPRYIDPTRPRGPVYRAFARLAATAPVLWWSSRVGWKVDPVLMRLTGGRVSSGLVLPTLLLETRGARTGLVRRNVVIYFHDGDDVVVVASKAGLPEHPGWLHNVRAEADVRVNGRPARAVEVDDPGERDRLWSLADRVFPPFEQYRRRAGSAGRSIPVIRITIT